MLILIKCALATDKKVEAILKAQHIVVTCLCNAASYACLFKFLLSNIHNSKMVLVGPRFFQMFALPCFWHCIMIRRSLLTLHYIHCNQLSIVTLWQNSQEISYYSIQQALPSLAQSRSQLVCSGQAKKLDWISTYKLYIMYCDITSLSILYNLVCMEIHSYIISYIRS